MPETANALRVMFQDIPVRDDTRWVDAVGIVTSAGLDTSLRLVARLENEKLAARTARRRDYNWQRLAEPKPAG